LHATDCETWSLKVCAKRSSSGARRALVDEAAEGVGRQAPPVARDLHEHAVRHAVRPHEHRQPDEALGADGAHLDGAPSCSSAIMEPTPERGK
jgi:hypothetical protein